MPTLTFRTPPAHPTRKSISPIVTMALLFWLFSYALFTSRVQLRGDEGLAALFTLRRLAATAVGALLYAGVLRFLIFPTGRKSAHPLVLVAAMIPAAAAMVAFRAAVDPLVAAEPLPIGDHVRWVLVWTGYFGLWLIGFHASRMYSERARSDSAAAPAARSLPSRQSLEELIEAIAEEAVRLPDAARRVLLQNLGETYLVADDPLDTAVRRGAIIRRIAERIAVRRKLTLRFGSAPSHRSG